MTSVDGHDVEDAQALRFRLATRRLGDTVEMRILRNGRERNIRMPLVAPPEDPPRNETMLEGAHPLEGARIANLSPALIEELGLQGQPRGVLVLAIRRRSFAARLGIRPGDILDTINDSRIERVAEAERALSRAADRWEIVVRRKGRKVRFEVR